MTSFSIFAFTLLFFGLSHSSPVPLNVAGTPNTACTIGTTPSMNYVKAITCLMESDVFNYMRDPSIPSFDVFRDDNWNSNTFTHDTASCNCIYPTIDTNQYISDPVYDVDPHVTVRYLYDPRIPYASKPPLFYRQELPENIQSNSVSTPVNTAWLLQDHINSLRGFIDYFVPAKLVQGGHQVELAALALNSTILPELDFQFSNQCPADNRVANFTGFPSSSCEFKCAVWHFNWTINGLYYALANQVIYPPATPVTQTSDPYPEKEEWVNKDCCSLPPINPVTNSEYRQLTCALSVLTYEAYNLFELLGSQASVECSGVVTVTGINVWTNYIQQQKFPPLTWSQSENLYIYTSHFHALSKQAQDLVNLTASNGSSCFSEFPGYQKKLNYTNDVFEFIFSLGEKWLKAHGCPSCSKCTVKDPQAVPKATPINPYLNCTDIHRQVSCLVLDIQKVADSLYLYLDMRDEASATWGKDCAPWSFF